ncbi:hypothetical protein DFH09DRAFT_1315680 [Mycena vulgaris]|nr:hypothetical protein DFH09DRAFT_1315680 [Mycena vulgaris]
MPRTDMTVDMTSLVPLLTIPSRGHVLATPTGALVLAIPSGLVVLPGLTLAPALLPAAPVLTADAIIAPKEDDILAPVYAGTPATSPDKGAADRSACTLQIQGAGVPPRHCCCVIPCVRMKARASPAAHGPVARYPR